MGPVRSVRNQYRGVNAHLHSHWQAVRGWNNFHNPYIAQIAAAQAGDDLEAGPFPVGELALDEALAELGALGIR